MAVSRWALCMAGVLLALPGSAAGDPIRIVESGTAGPSGQIDGYVTDASGFTGLRFFLPATIVTTAIGGHFAGNGGSDIFGAVVALSGPGDFPDSRDLSTPDVRGAARIVISGTGTAVPSRIVSAPLVTTLTPGWHAFVFGSGLFGASGSSLFVFENFPPGQGIFGSGGLTRPDLGYQNGVLAPGRLYAFLEGSSAPIPEPSTLLLVGTGAVAAIRWRARAIRRQG